MTRKRKITAIEPQKRHKNRRSIFLDGEFAFGVDEELVYKYGLHPDDELDAETIVRILEADENKLAKNQAVRYLSYRARSEQEMRDKLSRAGISEIAVDTVITELKAARLLDDLQFALSFIHDKMLMRPIGPLLIRQELRKRGIQAEFIDTALDQAFSEKSPPEIAFELIQKRYHNMRHLEWIKAKKRLADLLYRRGFDWDSTCEALEQLEKLLQAESGN